VIKTFVSVVFLMTLAQAQAGLKVIYGQDNRLDLYEVTNSLHLRLAQSTAAMVGRSQIKQTGLEAFLNFDRTLETSLRVCPNERFAQQPAGSTCSGFLVGEDTIVTAGHCLVLTAPTPEAACKRYSWVFNYALTTEKRNPNEGLSTQDVYHCKSVVTAKLTDNLDMAVIKLDRKVVGRSPLAYRTSGKVSSAAQLVVIGHPSGLPTKVAAGSKVLENSGATTFVTNLDTFQGNSGSAVFDANTGMLEGILVQGKVDYRPSIPQNPYSCQVVNNCDENGNNCELSDPKEPKGEVVTRITEALPYL